MKKRLFGFFMAFVLIIGLLPIMNASVFSKNENINQVDDQVESKVTLLFTDGNGNTIDSLSSETLITSLTYLNESEKKESLRMTVAVYSPDERLTYIGDDTQEVEARQTGNFEVSLHMPDNSDGDFAAEGYYVYVYLWNSVTFVPVMGKKSFSDATKNVTYPPDDKPIDSERLNQLTIDGYVEESLLYDNGTIRMIGGNFTSILVNNENDALEVFNQVAQLLGIQDSDNMNLNLNDITYTSAGEEDLEQHFYRMNPTCNDIPVLGSDIILVVNNDSVVMGLFTSYDSRINSVDTTPIISIASAEKIALDDLNVLLTDTYDETELITESKLIIDNLNRDVNPVLSWLVTIYNNGSVCKSYFIYANDTSAGTIYRKRSNIQEAWTSTTTTAEDWLGKDRELNIEQSDDTYLWRLRDDNRNIETQDYINYWNQIIKSTNDKEWDKLAVSAHANMAKSYDFYFNLDKRGSFDGKFSKIITSINDPSGTQWFSSPDMDFDNKRFQFRDTDEGALDIVGHEYTHAVIEFVVSNGLHYEGETGALNEAYADILGSFIESKYFEGKDDRKKEDRWLIGEDTRDIRTGSQTALEAAVRCLSKPSSKGQVTPDGIKIKYPEHYEALSDPEWVGINGEGGNLQLWGYDRDNEGVHVFCGIFGFASYKMIMDNDSCTSPIHNHRERTKSISDDLWAKIFYNSIHCLESNAKFEDASRAIILMAAIYGFNNDQIKAIEEAFEDVGIIQIDSDGTPEKPFEIFNKAYLEMLVKSVNGGESDYKNMYFKLMNNIDLEGGEWTPIGTLDHPFSGEFDGNGFVIKNLRINAPSSDYQGLFGVVDSGVIKNVIIDTNSSITGGSNVGALVGLIRNTSKIENCFNSGSVISKGASVGGIAGTATNDCTINDCHNMGNVTAEGVNTIAGGIVGRATCSITYCSNSGAITGNSRVGGIVGVFGLSDQFCMVDRCFNTGAISSTLGDVGGIAGYVDSNVMTGALTYVTNCYNTGRISCSSGTNVGGIVGLFNGVMRQCYNTESVKGKTNVGAVIGLSNSQNAPLYIVNNYYLEGIDPNDGTGSGTNKGGTDSISEGDLKDLSKNNLGSAYEVDVNNVNNGYPILIGIEYEPMQNLQTKSNILDEKQYFVDENASELVA